MMTDIIRCYVICERQSEEKFVNETLAPYFQNVGIYLTPLMIPTSEGHKGGGLNYERVFNFIIKQLKQDKSAFVTMMFDYYGLDNGFVKDVEYNADIYVYVENIQNKFDEAIRQQCDTNKFFSHIQPHEFESLFFSDIEQIIKADAEWSERFICELEAIMQEFDNPEFINNSKETSPSHRLVKIFDSPRYNKVLHGNKIVKAIGIENIRHKCQHFNKWCEKIHSLKSHKEGARENTR